VIDEFRSIGLAPAFEDGYIQSYETSAMRSVDGDLEFLNEEGKVTRAFTYGQDFLEMQYPSMGRNSLKGPLVDAHTWTYAEEVLIERGSVVLMQASQIDLKTAVAEMTKKGAAGILWFDPAQHPVLPKVNRLEHWAPSPQADLIAYRVSQECYSELARRIGETVRLTFDAQSPRVAGFNVAAVLGNPSEGIVVVSAHRDALGPSVEGSTIFPGAIDNASGTATLLEIARVLKADESFQDGVIFLSTDGEELGLTGANQFVARLPIEKDNLRFVVNMDCIGVRGAEITEIYTAAGKSTAAAVRDMISDSLTASGLGVKHVSNKYGSDHLSFERKGYETICLHCVKADMQPYYHGPKDTVETVDPKVLAAIVKAVSEGILKAPKAQ
jgi:aminopeptidase YwaD